MKWDNTDWLILETALLFGLAFLLVVFGCKSIPYNVNEVPINNTVTGTGNEVLTETNTEQNAGEVITGDSANSNITTNKVAMDENTKELLILIGVPCAGFLFFIVCFLTQVVLRLRSYDQWAVFGLGVLVFMSSLLFSLWKA